MRYRKDDWVCNPRHDFSKAETWDLVTRSQLTMTVATQTEHRGGGRTNEKFHGTTVVDGRGRISAPRLDGNPVEGERIAWRGRALTNSVLAEEPISVSESKTLEAMHAWIVPVETTNEHPHAIKDFESCLVLL